MCNSHCKKELAFNMCKQCRGFMISQLEKDCLCTVSEENET